MYLISSIKIIILHPLFLTYIGAICGHVLSLYSSEFKGSVPFFEKVFPNKSQKFYFRFDFIILPIIGALIAYFLLDPTTPKLSLFSGLSWSGTLIAFLKKNTEQIAKTV